MSPMTGNIDGLRVQRARWRQLEAAAKALEAAHHPSAAEVRHDADRLGRTWYTVMLPCILCRQPTACDVIVADEAVVYDMPPHARDATITIVIGGVPESVLCGRCNAATTAEVEADAAR